MTEEKNVYDDDNYNQPPVDEGFNRGSVAPHGGAMLAKAGEKGSLPVLEAFQDFLEEERKRSRNRMFILSAIFTLLLICVIFCGLFIGSVYLSKMKNELREVRFNSETEILKLQNETLRTLNNRGGYSEILPQQYSGMSEGQKAQVALMMQESQAEIDKLQTKISELQQAKMKDNGGPSNAAISNALVNVMREVRKMRKDMNSGASYYTPMKPAAAPPVKAPSKQVDAPEPPALEPVEVTAETPEPAAVKESVKEKPLPDTISVTINPEGKQGIVCALPMEID